MALEDHYGLILNNTVIKKVVGDSDLFVHSQLLLRDKDVASV